MGKPTDAKKILTQINDDLNRWVELANSTVVDAEPDGERHGLRRCHHFQSRT